MFRTSIVRCPNTFARQMIHVECQTLFSLKSRKKIIMLSAVAVIWVKSEYVVVLLLDVF